MEDESLETLGSLRHLFSADDSDSDRPPAPGPFFRNPIMQIKFDSPTRHPEGLPRSISLSLFVDAGPGCGGIAWPAGEVLASYIARRGFALQGLNVLELGSGTGLVGLVAGYHGAHVCITDQAPLIPIMERNISLNMLQSNVTAAELDWAKPLPYLQRPDIILAADCVYFEPAFPLLVSTLAALVPLPPERAPEVLFCYKKRRKADKRFFALLRKHFTWSVVDDDPARERYSREAITLLRLFRRS
ncbi:putative methyltransferase-domain-containing protein [Russula earlei]|uniref:Methyltransferase-domain-containing protein n=1 Tax=Russula earlei TaxID=71964 RepID=A0ACC0UIV8_9AGAM|nr:putative methyltransferase-domain-containing protein [Russula earlei]